MAKDFQHELLDDARELCSFRGWSEEIYRDFLALRQGTLPADVFKQKYQRNRAILSLDMTGLTSSAMDIGELESLLRILDAQRVCIPVLKEFGADLIRCFADDVVAIFTRPEAAIDAAFEVHRRIDLFNHSDQATDHPTRCCIGVGYGDVFVIGPNLAQGDEMNRASKLGEDIARANETLLTERTYEALKQRSDIRFKKLRSDDQLFPYFQAELIN